MISSEYEIHNHTKDRFQTLTPYALYDGAFNGDEIEKLCEQMSKQTLKKGIIARDLDKKTSEVFSEEKTGLSRSSDVCFLFHTHEVDWIFERFNHAIKTLNDRYFNFDLYGYDVFQYSEYKAEDLGCYDFHTDIALGGKPSVEFRKLSLVMLLNEPEVDFEGGEFEIRIGQEATKMPLKKGRILIMPSFIAHRVKIVTKGTRKSIVLWVTGPKFR